MSVREFELFHGVVLTKLLRSQRPVNLRMIETRPGEMWSAYTINDEVDLFIKHSTTPRNVARGRGGRSWPFVFGLKQLQQMAQSGAKRPVWVALVCGSRDAKDDDMQVCLLHPSQMAQLVDTSVGAQQTVTVRYVPRGKLRVFKGRREHCLVSQRRLDEWDVPGS
jgi:hypothetical protein